jgi:hypothetical protein
MVNQQIRLLLTALDFPGADAFTLEEIDQFQSLVFGLEDKYVNK